EGQEESLGTALDLAYERIPPQNEQENLIRDIQKISKDTGFAFQGLGFAQSFNADMNVPQLVVNFNVRGAYAQLFAFLRSVEQNPRLLGMNNIRLTMSEDRDLGRQVSTDLAVYALYQE
ncbi:MAG TPA: type 4a pilus biogenesis protein PilO, partial [Candidatus Gracilibacteria bacterium]